MYKNVNGERIKLTEEEQSELMAERKRSEKEIAANQYKMDRIKAYPKIEDQLDMLWHAMNEEEIPKAEPFYTVLKKVKDNNPKP